MQPEYQIKAQLYPQKLNKDKQEFMNVVNKAIVEGSIDSLRKILTTHPGRAPHKDLVDESNWYNSLNGTDREMVDRININKIPQHI